MAKTYTHPSSYTAHELLVALQWTKQKFNLPDGLSEKRRFTNAMATTYTPRNTYIFFILRKAMPVHKTRLLYSISLYNSYIKNKRVCVYYICVWADIVMYVKMHLRIMWSSRERAYGKLMCFHPTAYKKLFLLIQTQILVLRQHIHIIK